MYSYICESLFTFISWVHTLYIYELYLICRLLICSSLCQLFLWACLRIHFAESPSYAVAIDMPEARMAIIIRGDMKDGLAMTTAWDPRHAPCLTQQIRSEAVHPTAHCPRLPSRKLSRAHNSLDIINYISAAIATKGCRPEDAFLSTPFYKAILLVQCLRQMQVRWGDGGVLCC